MCLFVCLCELEEDLDASESFGATVRALNALHFSFDCYCLFLLCCEVRWQSMPLQRRRKTAANIDSQTEREKDNRRWEKMRKGQHLRKVEIPISKCPDKIDTNCHAYAGTFYIRLVFKATTKTITLYL